MTAIMEPAAAAGQATLEELVQSAVKRIPPLWPLTQFVAVNPFVGLSDRPFIEAAHLLQQIGHGELLMPAAFYREHIASGRIGEKEFQTALANAEKTLPAHWAEGLDLASLAQLDRALAVAPGQCPAVRVLTFADFLDSQGTSGWAAFVVEEISKWCSAYYDEGQSSWRMPWRHLNLFTAWKQAAQRDANAELTGLRQFRARVTALPDDPLALIDHALKRLAVPAEVSADFLHRQLMTTPGWSGYVQYLVRKHGMGGRKDDSLTQLLAIRLAYDLALVTQFGAEPDVWPAWTRHHHQLAGERPTVSPELLARYIAQLAWEISYQHELIEKLTWRPQAPVPSAPKTLQAVFCIDVRSEVFRRSLEAQSEEVETIGFAGFFGMPIEYCSFGETGGGALCPVLIAPQFKVRETLRHAPAGGESVLREIMDFQRQASRAWNSFRTSAISCFAFVETAGVAYGLRLVRDSLGLTAPAPAFATNHGPRQFGPKIEREAGGAKKPAPDRETGIALADQIGLAAGALKHMGLVANFARVVLICGHGSATTNNPYGSALDCGACGGHAGDVNARVAAAILNQPLVREGLKLKGIHIPAGTVFVAALHNTTTDEVLIYDAEALAPDRAEDLRRIKTWLAAASKAARRERAAALGLGAVPAADVDESIFARSRDWAQVRPEWGLANNAAFIAAPRERTRGLNLAGRTFLHNYRASRDAEKSTLELIMVAPMVVASWINLQYYGSTVDNRLFGSGNKVLHNVVGTIGVWQGNGGDLQPGLPLQSVHDGVRRMHEPLRLNVFIEAAREDIENVLARQPGVRELVANGWIHLFALEPAGPGCWRYAGNQFEPATA